MRLHHSLLDRTHQQDSPKKNKQFIEYASRHSTQSILNGTSKDRTLGRPIKSLKPTRGVRSASAPHRPVRRSSEPVQRPVHPLRPHWIPARPSVSDRENRSVGRDLHRCCEREKDLHSDPSISMPFFICRPHIYIIYRLPLSTSGFGDSVLLVMACGQVYLNCVQFVVRRMQHVHACSYLRRGELPRFVLCAACDLG